MKLQHLAIIFILIIFPISLVVGEYIQAQIDTINLQTNYSKRLQDATYDAIKAFQLNTVNNKYSSISDSKIRDIEASVNAFYNSIGTSMGASGYDIETLQEYIPAILYTMYDGYYIYGKYYNYKDHKYQYGLKPYIYYACRYVSGSYDFVINYTLDNNITIYGWVQDEGHRNYVTKSGYVVNPNLVGEPDYGGKSYPVRITYDGVTIEEEILTQQLYYINSSTGNIEGDVYQYTQYNNQRIYKENGKNEYFTIQSNKKQYLTDEGKVLKPTDETPLRYAQKMTTGGNLYSNSAVEYYLKARDFSKWLQKNIGGIAAEAKDANGNKLEFSIKDNNGNVNAYYNNDYKTDKIFKFGSGNNPLQENSIFNEHRKAVIRKSIETNLSSAIANYNAGSAGTYEFTMPMFDENDWEKILNNLSISTFLQGLPIKAKIFNSYCIITNDRNEEVVTNDSIYLLDKKKSDGTIQVHQPGCTDLMSHNATSYDTGFLQGYNTVDFELQTLGKSETDPKPYNYYHQLYKTGSYTRTYCYGCIVNISYTFDTDGIIEGKLTLYDKLTDKYKEVNTSAYPYFTYVRKAYLTALARERYDLYRTNGNIEIY